MFEKQKGLCPQNKNKGRRATLVGSFDLFATYFETRLAAENNSNLLKLVFATRLRSERPGTSTFTQRRTTPGIMEFEEWAEMPAVGGVSLATS